MAKRRVWNVEIIQQEAGIPFPISRGIREMKSRTDGERWLKRELESRSKPDRYGNIPYGGDGKGGPVKIVSTRVYSTWPEPGRPTYILDY